MWFRVRCLPVLANAPNSSHRPLTDTATQTLNKRQKYTMDRYFTSESIDEDNLELPSAKQIERSSFSVPDFDVDEFLAGYHQYQTLEDIQDQLRTWTRSLEQELVDLINEDYGQFVGLGMSLAEGKPKAQDIKVEILGFQQEIKQVQKKLETSAKETDSLIQEKAQLREMEV